MSAVTFGDAAAHLGHKSRSTLYRLKRDGFLEDYLRPGGKAGAQLLELAPEGLPTLRDYCRGILLPRSDSPLWRDEPEPEPDPWADVPEVLRSADGSEPFWSKWGRIAGPDEPPLSEPEFWGHVGSIMAGMMGRPLDLTPAELADLAYNLREAVADVEAGARFDQARWYAANVRCLLEDLPCDLAAAELEEQLKAGRVPAEVVEAVREALAAA